MTSENETCITFFNLKILPNIERTLFENTVDINGKLTLFYRKKLLLLKC